MRPTPTQHARRTLDGAVLVSLAEALAVPTGLISLSFLTRTLGSDDYGRLTLAATIVIWLEWSLSAMLSRATNRLVAETETWEPIASAALRLYVLAGAGTGLLLWSLASPLATSLHEPQIARYLQWFALELPLFCAAQAHIQVLIARGHYRQRAWISAARWLARLALLLVLVGCGFSVFGAIAASIGTVVIELVMARRVVAILWGLGDRSLTRRLLRYATPLLIAALCARLFNRIDLIAFKSWGASASQAGEYAMAQNLATVPNLLALACAPLLQSTLVRMQQHSSLDEARQLARHALRLACLLLPFAALVSGAAGAIATLLSGPGYAGAAPVLARLILASIAGVVVAVSAAILVGFDQPRWTVAIAMPMLLVAVVLLAWIVPVYGARGAASVTLGCGALAASASLGVVSFGCKVTLPFLSLFRSVVVAIAVYAAATFVEPPWLVPKLALLTLAIPVTLILLGEFSRQELGLIRTVGRNLLTPHDS